MLKIFWRADIYFIFYIKFDSDIADLRLIFIAKNENKKAGHCADTKPKN